MYLSPLFYFPFLACLSTASPLFLQEQQPPEPQKVPEPEPLTILCGIIMILGALFSLWI